jgi:hypothetical protein
MAFPSQSTALSSAPGSLWWGANYVDSTGVAQDHMCAASGDVLIAQAQQTLIALAPTGGPPNGNSTPQLNPQSLVVDKKLGVKTLTALWNLVQGMNAPQAVLDDIAADWFTGSAAPNSSLADAFSDTNQGNPVHWGTMAALIWITFNRDIAFSSLTIPPDLVGLQWGTAPPVDNSGFAGCWKAGDPTPVEAGGGSATTTVLVPEGSYVLGGPGASNQTSSNFFSSVSSVFSGQTTGSATMDLVIPIGLAVAGVAAIALIIAATDKKRSPARRRRATTRRRR